MPSVDLAPADIDSEWDLIGSCLRNTDHIPEAVEVLSVEAFTDPRAALLFEAIRRAVSDDASDAAIEREAKAAGVEVADIQRAMSVPSAVNFEFYLSKVLEAWSARRVFLECQTIAQEIGRSTRWSEILETATSRVHEASESGSRTKSVRIADAIQSCIASIESGRPQCYATGFRRFDDLVGGWPRAGLVTIVGPSGHGKSTFALNVAVHIARTTPVRMFSFEMSAERIGESVAAMLSRRPFRDYTIGGRQPGMEAWQDIMLAHDAAKSIDLEVVDDLLDARKIFARCWRYSNQGVGVVVIDYLQNLPILPGHDSHFSSIVESAQLLQRVARKFGLCVVMVCQGDKEATRKARPMGLGDAYGGIVVQQVTDLGISVYRPGYVDDSIPKDEANILVVKNKYGQLTSGESGIRMHFDGATSMFQESTL